MAGHSGAMSGLGTLSLWAVFALGLTGGFGHCLMMCGPFVAGTSLGVGLGGHSARSATVFQVAYHAGRLITYTTIGLLLGLLGEAGALSTLQGPFSPTALSRYLKLGVGVVTLAMGAWLMVSWVRGRAARLPEPTAPLLASGRFTRIAAALVRRGGRFGLPLGMLMGLLPCGPLLPVELTALASGVPLYGAVIMLSFGLGTVPALAGFGVVSALAGSRARGLLAGAMALTVVTLGAVTLTQGLAVVS